MKFLTSNIIGLMINSLLSTAGGFCSPYGIGATAMRRKVRGFFYALTVMVGGVWGSRRGLPVQYPVCKPYTSSAALSFAAPDGGNKTTVLESIMTSSNIVPLRTSATKPSFSLPSPSREALILQKKYPDLSCFLRAAIDYILLDFYAAAQPDGITAIVLRILAAKADHLASSLEKAHV